MFVAALAFGLPGCGDDGSTGSGDTETGTGTAGGSGTDATMTMSTTASMTTAGMTAGNDGSTGDTSPPADSTGAPSDSTGMPGDSSTGGGGQSCEECGLAECGDVIKTCLGVEECACWLGCLGEGNAPMDCGEMCKGPPPEDLDPVQECVDENCAEACAPGGDTGGTTGGGNADGHYDECDPLGGGNDCDKPLVCNMFLGYCTVDDCENDDDCPDPGSGDVQPSCSQFGSCVLECDNGSNCPDGMSCQGGGFSVCGY